MTSYIIQVPSVIVGPSQGRLARTTLWFTRTDKELHPWRIRKRVSESTGAQRLLKLR